jgi:hypothetical protein
VLRVGPSEHLELERDVQSQLSPEHAANDDATNRICLVQQASHARSLPSLTNVKS